MKKQQINSLLVIFLMTILCSTSFAQDDYKKFKVGLGIGYAVPSDGGGGIILYTEPAYRINDMISIGLRLESALMARSVNGEEGSISGNGSYSINGQYYLKEDGFRPFVGLGVGIYSLASVAVNSNSANGSIEAGDDSKIGFYPRIGFDAGHFNLTIDYNIIGKSELEGISVDGNSSSNIDIKNGYLGIKLGFSIGGGNN